MASPRTILHVDMDAFFASVEQRDDPALRGRPVLVGHDGPRGVVAAASYEARRFGCHSAQPISVAKRRCPDAIIVHGHYDRYRTASKQMFGILESVTPLVEPLSIDEAFLDVSGSLRLLGDGATIAQLVRQRIFDDTQLTASVGVAPNKFLAKLCSEWDKPDGLTVITSEEIPGRLAPIPVRAMWGVGPALEAKLSTHGLRTFGDLQRLDPGDAERWFGVSGPRIVRLSNGEDERGVHPDGEAKSISQERTFGEDVSSDEVVRTFLLDETENVAMRLRRHGLRGRTVTVRIRYGDFETITRSTTLDEATDRTDLLWAAAKGLFDGWARTGFRPVRLIGMGVSQFVEASTRQLPLFGGEEDRRVRRIDETTDTIRQRFGTGSIRRGVPYTDGGS